MMKILGFLQDGKTCSSKKFSYRRFRGAKRHFLAPRLVTLQSLIIDTEQSLAEVIRSIDNAVVGDAYAKLVCFPFFVCSFCLNLAQKREVSQRESRIAELHSNCGSVKLKTDNRKFILLCLMPNPFISVFSVREQIRVRREQLRERQRRISLAKEQDDELSQHRTEIKEDIQDER